MNAPASTPIAVGKEKFNLDAVLPYGLTVQHVYNAMNKFVGFLGFINQQSNSKKLQRFESMLMPVNFSSMVGEFMTTTLPKHCGSLVKNLYHNGHPDLVPIAGIAPFTDPIPSGRPRRRLSPLFLP